MSLTPEQLQKLSQLRLKATEKPMRDSVIENGVKDRFEYYPEARVFYLVISFLESGAGMVDMEFGHKDYLYEGDEAVKQAEQYIAKANSEKQK